MTETLQALLRELESFGIDNDAATDERAGRMLNITRDTGEFLAVLVRATQARRVLEIGTSNGYSTLWLAAALAPLGGQVTTVELAAAKRQMAAGNFARSGLEGLIVQLAGDAGACLRTAPSAHFDLIFLDSERSDYPAWLADLKRVLRPGGLLVVDNALSHAEEMQPFVTLVTADKDFTTCTVPVGKGEFMATLRA